MNAAAAREKFDELRRQEGRIDPRELDEIWAALEPVTIDDLIGHWKGGNFDTGHRGTGMLEAINWHGKWINSATDAKPVVCHGEDGELFSNQEAGGGGEATLWMVEFRGELTATLAYDCLPILDHFKRVNENTLMGIMNGRPELVLDEGQFFYFFLDSELSPAAEQA